MDNEKFDSRVLEPDLICSKDGDVLERSARENVRMYDDMLRFALPRILAQFGRGFR